MVKVLVFVFCCVSSTAFASSADSGKCPWKLPFIVKIHSTGVSRTHSYNVPTHRGPNDYDTSWSRIDSADFPLTLDTSTAHWDTSTLSVSRDTLRLANHRSNDTAYNGIGYHSGYSYSLEIAFTPEKDSILSLTYIERYDYLWANTGNDYSTTFRISKLEFNDTSIFTEDSSFAGHNVFLEHTTDNEVWDYFPNTMFGTFNHSDFTATSVTLSGLFRPTHFSDPSSVTKATLAGHNLAVTNSNGSLLCSFVPEEQQRVLEVYSILGTEVGRIDIPAGVSEAGVPRLAPGFYVIRLGGEVAKVYLSP